MTYRAASFASTMLLGSLVACGARVTVDLGTGAAAGTGGTTATGVGTSSGGATSSSTTAASSSSSTTTSSSSSTTASSSSSTTTSSGSTCPATPPLTGPCAPGPSCGDNGSTCLAHVSQAGSGTPGFRMAEIDFAAPTAFTAGVVGGVIEGAATPNEPNCNLNGSATLSWLLRFDIGAATLETGGAKPVPNAAGPYSFVDEMVTQGPTTFHVQPVTVNGPLTSSCNFVSSPADVIIPIYLDSAGTQAVLLPLRGLQIAGSTSADRGCIGRYNAEGLDPANNCLPDNQHGAFQDGGKLSASIRLEDADTVDIGALNESLCVLLSGNSSMYGTQNGAGMLVCKRDGNGHIVFQGDWCSTTNQAGGCADAMRVAAGFAAQAVKIQ